jgi:Flp pilus assembly protein TadD
LLKAYRQVVQANPADAGTWRLIAEIAGADDVELAKEALRKLISLMPGDAKAQKQLAQLYEWNGQPNLAFDLYLKLSEQNDQAALERLIALNPGLYRDKDLLRPLRALSGEAHQEKYRLTLARLLIKHGEYAEAYSLYQMHLQHHPDDAAVMEEYGRTLQRQQAYESALSIWKSLQELKPEDEAVRGHIAEIYYLLGDFENSLRTYQQLAKRSTDLAAILKYVTLADSLGELQSLGEATARAMELKKQAAPEDFVRLAYTLNLLGADAKRQGVLERGLTLFPTNDTLRIQLAVLLVEKDEGGRALPIMARSHSLKTDLNALRLYLELLIASGNYAAAETFLETGIAEKLLDTQSIVLLRAIIYERNQNNAAAERIHENLYRQHPGENSYALGYLRILIRLGKAPAARKILQSMLKAPTPEILREAARVNAELGDFKEAEKLQALAMEPLGKASLQDWSDLGDIRFSAGNRSAARRAYRQALVAAGINLRSQPP